ncbi:adenylate/guanylate cyclase domain-containing protein [Actinomycetospora termitidis]|uniref:Adenylate/guanylate cyclase domain-containing protein n=1 Tax=Actinomycetospora termitidis TaxID=3053470 RepID=A0ABT7MHS4_9PSEU|nr:adenylate/guanylate cyclase domain-containing protein [Actinomycetospora sp. Odt1-22]MDL5160224.1 adenylate/guanylate cyclase domain-containing protein [Actinomycetospora sp. Odt1-22]
MTSARAPERRLVHVLFVDLVGFTSLVEELDAEDVAMLQEHYFSQVSGLVAAAGGQVEKYIGDAVLATFGLPALGPDDAVGAVRAGLAVIDSLTGVEADLGLPAGTLAARVGVHTGEVVVTWAPDGGWRLSGDVVNTAARLQASAEPGTVVVGPETALAVGTAFTLDPLGEVALKGKAERVAAYRVSGRRARAARTARDRFRGRTAELARLQATHRAARGAERLTVLAPPGVGRSRLVEEFRDRSDGPVWLVRVRRDEPAYAPVAALLTAAGVTPDGIEDRLARHGHTGARAEVSARHTAALLTGAELTGSPQELWTSWTAVLDAHDDPGGPTPVWVLDDVHLAGADLHAFLAHASSAPHRPARLLLSTARPEALAPEGDVLVLDPLPDADVVAIVADRAPDLPAAVVEQVRRAAGGNPLFVVELLRAWEQTGTAGEATVPSTVRAIYLGQLDALPPSSRTLLGQGSVAGRTLPASALPDLGVAEPATPLADLTGAGLLRGPHPDVIDPSSYTYRHTLLHETAYATLPRARRAELHERFADWLDRRGGPRRAERVGRHLAAAHDEAPVLGGRLDRVALARRAATALTEAGEAAIGSEPLHAAELFARAHDLGVAADPSPSEERAHRRLRRAEALRRAGRLPEAMEAFAVVAEAAAPGTYRVRAAAALGYEDALFDSRLPRSRWGARALELLEDARTLTPADETGLRARLLAALARAHAYGGDVPTAEVVGDEAVALARSARDPGALAYALLARRPTLAAPRALQARLAADSELLTAARAAGDGEREFEALRLQMVDLLELGSTTEAVALADEASALAVRLGRPLHLWYPAMWRAAMLLHHGDLDDAAEAVEHFRVEGERWHYGDVGQVHSVQLLTLHTALGTPELALPTLRHVAQAVGGRTWVHVAVGLARAGALDEASDLLRWSAADGFAVLGDDGARAFLLAECAETALLVSNAGAAATLRDLLEPWAGLVVVVGSGALCLGAVDHFRGLAARAAGDDAAPLFRAALDLDETSGAVRAADRSRAELLVEGRSRC